MLPLTKEELKSHQDAKVFIFVEKDSFYWKVRDHRHYPGKYNGAAHNF